MDMTLRAATPAERLYAYGQSKHMNERCGNCICFVHKISSGYLSLNGRAQLVRFPTKFSRVPQRGHDLIAECCRL